MNNQGTSNLDEILGLNQEEKIDEQNHLNLIDSTEPSTTDTSDTKPQSWADNSGLRLLLGFLGSGVVVVIFMAFYGGALDLKSALKNSRSKEVASISETTEIEADIVTEENLRGAIAIGEQRKAIAEIENLKPKPEIKLEPITTPPEEIPQVIKPAPSTPTPKPRVQGRHVPSPKPKIKRQTPPVIKYDSMKDWQVLAQLGSYGNKSTRSNEISSVASRFNTESSESNQPTSLPPLLAINYESQDDLTTSEAKFLEALQTSSEPVIQSPKSEITIAVAQQVKGQFTTPINWVSGDKQRSFIKLEEPLLDNQGNIKIEKESLLVYEIGSIRDGIIQGEIVGIISQGKEILLPPEAISLFDRKGNMLTAKYKQINNGNNNPDVISFLHGAAEKTSDLITQPDSSFSQVSSLGQTQSTNFEDKNYPGAIISGGAEEVLKNRSQELQRRRSTNPISNFWQVKKGTKVIIQINREFAI